MNNRELPDRRRGSERRGAQRYSVTIDVECERGDERFAGTVSDISENGCFVLSGTEVENGQEVTVLFPIGDGMKVQFSGEITNHVFEIGFAIRFPPLSDGQKNVIRNFLRIDPEDQK